MTLSDELAWRGFIKDKTFENTSWLNQPRKFYHGVDGGSADSLTVGNLAALMLARHLVKGGWKPVLLVGGATSLVGDPGGKESERPLPNKDTVSKNVEAIKKQIERFFEEQKPQVVNNIEWLGDIKLLDFLRDVGKNYSMTELIQRDFVVERMNEGGSGISYAELSYTLIQGYDFWYLHKNHDVQLQVGGSDQWGNMLSGVSLIRKKEGAETHALSMPLVINKATGRKFGKSEEGAVWLDPEKTTPTQFYQFWINADDQDVEDYLKIFTLLPKKQIEQVMDEHRADPSKRKAQKLLGNEVTSMVHGSERGGAVTEVTKYLTSQVSLSEASDEVLNQIRREIPTTEARLGQNLVELLVKTGLASSKTEARRLMADGAIYINGRPSKKEFVEAGDLDDGMLLLRRGKAFKDSALVEIT